MCADLQGILVDEEGLLECGIEARVERVREEKRDVVGREAM